MKCLFLHNSYMYKGGEDESVNAEMSLLLSKGHEIEIYQDSNERIADIGQVSAGIHTIWSNSTYSKVDKCLRAGKFDIVHIQNFFPLISPAAHYAAKKNGVPVVQSLRNYRLICPNALLYRDNNICNSCVDKFVPFPGVIHKCYRDSYLASTATAAMIASHRFLGTWRHRVDAFITSCEFARQKFIQGGLPQENLFVKANCLFRNPIFSELGGNFFIFVGRLSPEKGLKTLLAAWSQLDQNHSLKIVGEGPLEDWACSEIKHFPNIEYLGFQTQDQVQMLMRKAKALIFPSTWYETFGRVIIESFASGTPVIASNLGGISEIVKHGHNGLLFKPGNATDLIEKILRFESDLNLVNEMRKNARLDFEGKYTAEINYEILMDIYAKAILNSSKKVSL